MSPAPQRLRPARSQTAPPAPALAPASGSRAAPRGSVPRHSRAPQSRARRRAVPTSGAQARPPLAHCRCVLRCAARPAATAARARAAASAASAAPPKYAPPRAAPHAPAAARQNGAAPDHAACRSRSRQRGGRRARGGRSPSQVRPVELSRCTALSKQVFNDCNARRTHDFTVPSGWRNFSATSAWERPS